MTVHAPHPSALPRPLARSRPPIGLAVFAPVAAMMATLLLAACGGGGGGGTAAPTEPAPTALRPTDLAVLYAAGDATSESIARAYQQARGIPEANVLAVTLPTRNDVISSTDFTAMKTALDARLPASVQATLVTWTAPSRVAGSCTMGLTAALALGYDTRYCGGCAATATTPYYNSPSAQPWSALRIRPSMMLGAATLAEAQVLINRGVAADRSMRSTGASAEALLMRTDEAERSVRWNDFRTLAGSTGPGLQFTLQDNAAGTGSNEVTGRSKLLFYFTGTVRVNNAVSNTWLPGAAADHLTSFGGVLPNGNGQMPATEWLRAGATASYGTVEEPCAYEQKFPRASVLVNRYAQGDTLIEAYWKSVQWPGQGLFIGEPLARPWAP